MKDLLFCENDQFGFPHWDGFDAFRWYILPTSWDYLTGDAYLWIYKSAWFIYHRDVIKQYAFEAQTQSSFLLALLYQKLGGCLKGLKD